MIPHSSPIQSVIIQVSQKEEKSEVSSVHEESDEEQVKIEVAEELEG